MSFVQANSISLAFGDRDILDSVHVNLGPTTKAALSGSNGCGKSTFLKILAGLHLCDSGKINMSTEARVAYLPQTGIVHKGCSLLEETEKAFDFVVEWIEKKENIEKKLATIDKKSPELLELIDQQYLLDQKIQDSGYYHRDKEILIVLQGLGFSQEDLQKDCGSFSGGWQMRIALAQTLLKRADILLLDEPTNYLDIEAREWLTDFLISCKSGFLIVSHDRYFLDKTIHEVYELFEGKINRYKGSYSDYEAKRKIELESLIKNFTKQQEEIEKNELFIRRFRATASKASAVQSRVKLLAKIKRIELPDNLKQMKILFPQPPRSGDTALEISQLTKRYGEKTVFKELSFHVQRGERIAVTGVNGAGKTTLLKIIAGIHKADEGAVKEGSKIEMGYFAQESGEALTESNTIEEELEQACPSEMIPRIRSIAGSFLFSDADFYKKISILSGGERNRVTLLKLILKPYNLLVLDEPTNHLDIHSKEILLYALSQYSGTILFVSHDHYFLQQLATRVIHLENETLQDFQGNYDYYSWKMNQSEENSANSQPDDNDQLKQNESSGALTHQQQKEQRNKLRNLEKQEEQLLIQIEEKECKLEDVEAELIKPEVYSDAKKAKSISAKKILLEKEIAELTEKWEATSILLNDANV